MNTGQCEGHGNMAKVNLSAAYNAMATPAREQIDVQNTETYRHLDNPLQVAESINQAI